MAIFLVAKCNFWQAILHVVQSSMHPFPELTNNSFVIAIEGDLSCYREPHVITGILLNVARFSCGLPTPMLPVSCSPGQFSFLQDSAFTSVDNAQLFKLVRCGEQLTGHGSLELRFRLDDLQIVDTMICCCRTVYFSKAGNAARLAASLPAADLEDLPRIASGQAKQLVEASATVPMQSRAAGLQGTVVKPQ